MRALRGPHGLNTWLPLALDTNVWASLQSQRDPTVEAFLLRRKFPGAHALMGTVAGAGILRTLLIL
jgi:hypothetical protein